MAYNTHKPTKTTIDSNDSYEAESIEEKVRRIPSNQEPITDGAPLIYTTRKDGVQPQYDVRTDRFELAVEMMDKVATDKLAKREARIIDMETKHNTRTEGENSSE